MSVDDRLAALRTMGAQVDLEKISKPGASLPKSPVQRSRELDRVLALPRRGAFTPEHRERLREALTRPDASMRLWDVQCDALLAALEHVDRRSFACDERVPGLFAAIAVGGGKTLITALLGTVWGSKRPVIMTTAALARQAEQLIDEYRRHFYIPDRLQILPYSQLSHPDHSESLSRLNPDSIACDEAHSLASNQSARGKRLRRYLKSRPSTLVGMLTGTIAKRSLLEWSELAGIALCDWSPAPRDRPTRVEWAGAVDPDPHRPVGCLALLVGTEEDPILDPLDKVRAALARRVRETPGCVTSPSEAIDVELVVRLVSTPHSDAIERQRATLAATWCAPDGEELVTAVEYAEVDRQVRLGGFYSWESEPDREWLDARRTYRRAVRHWLSDHPGRAANDYIDSPERLERALERGEVLDEEVRGAWLVWVAQRDSGYVPPPRVWRWIDEVIARWAAEQLMTPFVSDNPNVIAFGKRVGFARRVAELAGAPYHGEGQSAAQAILQEDGSRPVVASMGAHGQGRNLQVFSRALLLDPPPSGAHFEQLLGRLHRPGQKAPSVIYEVPDMFVDELERAIGEARWLSLSTGLPQKLVEATIEGRGLSGWIATPESA